MWIIGNLEDQIGFLAFARIPYDLLTKLPYSYYLSSFLEFHKSSEPLTFLLARLLQPLFHLNYFNVMLVLFSLSNLIFSFLLFKKYKAGLLYALIFSFSSYYWLHLGTHMALIQLWLYPLSIIILSHGRIPLLLKGVFLCISALFSNYIAFFIFILFSLDTLLDFSIKRILTGLYDYSLIKKYLLVCLFSLFLLFLSLNEHFTAIYFNDKGYNASNSYVPVRPYSDFFTFSSRPWYFLIPSPKHLVYGDFSSKVVDTIKATGYFLGDDYFEGEHGASFFGYFLLFAFIFVSLYILFRGTRHQKTYLIKYWSINLALFLLMMPPYFTINGVEIYTPGWLIYKFFPMFRTTVRMSVLILLNILIVLSMFFDDLYIKFGSDVKKKFYLTGFIFLLTGITLFETFIPIKIQYLNTPPEVYSYIGINYKESNFVVYPYSKTQEALFWVDAHNSYLMNPRMYIKDDFNSESFTKGLNTGAGLISLKNLPSDVTYLVVFKNIEEKDKIFFLNSINDISLLKEFSDSYLFRVKK